MTLTAVDRHRAYHRMLAVALAAVFYHSDIVSTLLETGQACPDQKGTQGSKGNQNAPPLLMS